MNSTIVHINFAKTWRGGERQVVLLYSELRKLNIKQKLFCRKGSSLHKYCVEHDFDFESFSTVSSFLLAPFLLSLYRLKGPLIVHCHESKGQTVGVLGRFFSMKKIPVIVHRRVLFPIKQKFTTNIKYSRHNIEKIICISKAVENVVKDCIGFPATAVVPSCASFEIVNQNDVNIRSKYNINPNCKLVGYIAALTFEKDHSTFLKTAVEIKKQIEDVHFLIVGSGPTKNKLINQVTRLGIEDSVTFTGFLKNPERIISQIDVLLFTSRSEGLGSTILDFFVYKKPVVSVRNGGAEEIIINEKTGLLSPVGDYKKLADQVMHLLSDSSFVKNLTDNAYEYVRKHHSPKKVALLTLGIYKELLDG